jgi:hypothetical protein
LSLLPSTSSDSAVFIPRSFFRSHNLGASPFTPEANLQHKLDLQLKIDIAQACRPATLRNSLFAAQGPLHTYTTLFTIYINRQHVQAICTYPSHPSASPLPICAVISPISQFGRNHYNVLIMPQDQGAPPAYPQPTHQDAGPPPGTMQPSYYNQGSGPEQYGASPNPYQQGQPDPYGQPQGQYGYNGQQMQYQQGPPPPGGYYQDDRRGGGSGSGGLFAGLCAGLACCCCLDCLF